MRFPRSSRLLILPLALALAGAGCGDDTDDNDASDAIEDAADDAGDAAGEATDDAVEAAARNLASAQGEDEFSAAGIEVEGDFTCEASVTDDRGAVEISCTGESTDGQALAMEGTTSEVPGASVTELEGDFVGTADGEEVFAVDTLGG